MSSQKFIDAQVADCETVGEDVIFGWRAGGASVTQIRRNLGFLKEGDPIGAGVRGVYKWLHQTPERWAEWQKMGRMGAEAIVDENLEIADAADEDTVQVARLRIEQRRYAAERLDPETFAKPTAGTVVNIGTLHLTAATAAQADLLAERNAMRQLAAGLPDAGDAVVRTPDFSSLLD